MRMKIKHWILPLLIFSLAGAAQGQQKKRNFNVVLLSLASQGAAAADEYTTLQVIRPQKFQEAGGVIILQPAVGVEEDPLARPFVGLPTPMYYATGALMSGGMTYWSLNWRKKRGWRGRLWWLPQLLQTGLNGYLAYRNEQVEPWWKHQTIPTKKRILPHW